MSAPSNPEWKESPSQAEVDAIYSDHRIGLATMLEVNWDESPMGREIAASNLKEVTARFARYGVSMDQVTRMESRVTVNDKEFIAIHYTAYVTRAKKEEVDQQLRAEGHTDIDPFVPGETNN